MFPKNKKRNHKLTSAAYVLLLLTLNLYSPFLAHAQNPLDIGVETIGIDTIAGYSALIKTVPTLPNKNIDFKIKKPSGSEILIPAQTDDHGIAQVDLYDYHTRRAGIYEISAKFTVNETFGPINHFRVYPDEISPEQSIMFVNKQTALADSLDQISLSVTLKDHYGNPIEGHTVEIIPSRGSDKIVRASRQVYTNSQGEIEFFLGSSKPGISVYTAYDSTANQTLKQRAKIVYYDSINHPALIGGYDTTPTAYAQETDLDLTPVDHLKIENLPDLARINESLNFKITAYTEKNEIATHYTGTVRFSSTDDNANLPIDFTFQENHLGQHTFSLGLSFITPGLQTLSVNDLSNANLKDQTEITITTEEINNLNETIILLTPTEGTYSQADIEVSGEAPVGFLVKIYSNDQEIGETYTGTDERFTYQANLRSGLHTIYAALIDENNEILEVSDEISIQIDLTPAIIDYLEILPANQVSASTLIEIKILSEPNLPKVSIVLDNSIYELTENLTQPGTYSTNIAAPSVEGSYSIDVILIDQLGNEASLREYSLLTITPNEITNPSGPKTVTGITAIPSDNRVTLTWDPPENENIYHYRIYFGNNADYLDQMIDTFDDNTTWYISNLTPGTTYYFQIVAVNFENQESVEKSAVVNAIPEGEILPSIVTGVVAVPEVNRVTLSWEPATDDTYINHYEIIFGTEPAQMNEKTATFDDSTTWYISDLTGDITYYFGIIAIDSDSNKSWEPSQVVETIPIAPPLPNQTPDTGPATLPLIGFTGFISAGYILVRILAQRKKDYYQIGT